MKKIRFITLVLSVLMFGCVFMACQPQTATLTYSGSTLSDATAGTAYSASVATATGATNITYALKDSTLPAGLTLSSAGVISGTPTAAVQGATFKIEASAENATAVQATFTITVLSGDTVVYSFEAEYTPIADLIGRGESFTLHGTQMAVEFPFASNGFAIMGLNSANITLTFTINSNAAASASLAMFLGTSQTVENFVLKPETFKVSLNGASVAYTQQTVNFATGAGQFKSYTVGNINLVAGENVITLTVIDNDLNLLSGAVAGPLVDKITLSTTAELTWEPIESNIE